MATYKFTVQPGVEAPAGAPALGLTNIRPVVEPAGRVKALLDRLSGNYTAFQEARIAQTFFDLSDAGILDRLDLLCIRGLNLADSLMNWAGEREVTNHDATFTDGLGMVTDGSASYIDLNWEAGNYQLGDASLFGFLPDGSPAGQFFGRAGSGPMRAQINVSAGGANTAVRLNYQESTIAPHGDIRTGVLWSVAEASGANLLYRDSDLLVTGSPASSYGLPTGGIAIGTDNFANWMATAVSAFGYGGALTAEQFGVLSGAIKSMHLVI